MKKTLNTIFFIVLLLVGSLVSKDAANMIAQCISNYQSLSLESLSAFPLWLFTATVFITAFIFMDIAVDRKGLPILIKRISVAVMIISALGMAMSFFTGAVIYHSFTAVFVIKAYPLVMLCVHAVFFMLFALLYRKVQGYIANSKETIEAPAFTGRSFLRIFAHETIMIFSGSFLGELLIVPVLWSEHSWRIIPFYIQLAVPAVEFLLYILYKNFVKPENKHRFAMVSSIALGSYTVISLALTLIAYFCDPIIFVSLTSPLLQIERLISFPICFVLIYAVSIMFIALNAINWLIKRNTQKKAI